MIDALRIDPAFGKPLKRELAGLWSARVGRHRVIYRWSARLLTIVIVGPREGVYEEAARLRHRELGR